MRSYRHITLDDRIFIKQSLMSNLSYRQIAKILNRSPSSIMREVKRNLNNNNEYLVNVAEDNYRSRRKKSKRKTRFYQKSSLINYVKKYLLKAISAEAIASLYRNARKGRKLSGTTIRKAVKMGYFKDITPKRVFRRKGVKKNKGISATIQTTADMEIANRPLKHSSRDYFGNWEADTVVGKVGTGVILTLVDRKTRLLIARNCPNKRADTIKFAIINALQWIECKSITYDRGSEFACHQDVAAALNCKTYFADPHSPWQRGTNENTNKMLRAFYPKGSNFSVLKDEKLEILVSYINNTPRRIFDYAGSAMCAKRYLIEAEDSLSKETKKQIQVIDLNKLRVPNIN